MSKIENLSITQTTNLINFLKRVKYSKRNLIKELMADASLDLEEIEISNKNLEELIQYLVQRFDLNWLILKLSSDIYDLYNKTISQGQVIAILRKVLGLKLSSTERSQLHELRKKIKRYELFLTHFGEWGKEYDYVLKMLLFGLSEEQASKLIYVLDKAKVSAEKKTVGVDFYTKLIENYDKSLVMLQIWDISPHRKFGFLRNQYYRGAIAAIMTFDKGNRESFDLLKQYYTELKEKTNLKFRFKKLKNIYADMPITLIGIGKSDLIPMDEVYSFVKEINAQYVELDNIDDDSFQNALTYLTYQVITRYLEAL